MIKEIILKFGSAPDEANVKLNVAPVTVFVGPNNSGKSKVLQELNRHCTTGQAHPTDVILESVEFSNVLPEKVEDIKKKLLLTPRKNETVQQGRIFIGRHDKRLQVRERDFLQSLDNPNANKKNFCQWYLALYTLILDGKSRINLTQEREAGDLQKSPSNYLSILFRDDEKRQEVRRIAYDAFGTYFVVDPTNLGKLRIRYSPRPPEDVSEERGIDDRSVKFHKSAINVDDASDGVKAFTGIVTQIIAGDPRVVIIDEPEAFLHPALSAKLGKEISISASASDKRLFVSTHSASFVMGCVQSGAPTNIVRLTYQHGVATARALPNEKLLQLMRNPLLRSTGVLEGLFYESVIVTEADSDRAFYQEINERLLAFGDGRGIPNCLFLNAQNKQTVHQVIKPLREMGIPAAAIVDVDILKEGGSVWTDFLKGGFIPEASHLGLGQTRSTIKRKCDESGKNMKREGGIGVLDRSDREAAVNLFKQLADYGLFVVEGGELESWLPELKVSGHGPAWLIETFEKMGSDPDGNGYVRPAEDGVWHFMDEVAAWMRNPNRSGIPDDVSHNNRLHGDRPSAAPQLQSGA